jgi:hypothetical protein
MRPDPSRPFFRAAAAQRIELMLYRADGAPWVLSVSPGIERFIGHYPRLDGIEARTPLLEYRVVQAAG